MILTIHIDNRVITLAAQRSDSIAASARIGADPLCTADQYAACIRQLLSSAGIDTDALQGAVISSVVPKLTPALSQAAMRLTHGKKPLFVGAGIKTGLNLRLDSVSTVGSDFICNAVAALSQWEPPLVILNLVNATTFSAIDQNRVLTGRSILPGVQSALEHLCESSAQLPEVSLSPSAPLLGRSTADAIRSGALYGTISMVEGMLARYREALGGGDIPIIATGDAAPWIAKHFPGIHFCEHLLLDGLRILYFKNTAGSKS